MKNLLTLFLVLSTIHCFGQTETKEDFVNQVYHKFFDSTYKCYYVSSTAGHVFLRNNLVSNLEKNIRTQFKNIIPDSVLEKLIAKAAFDTVNEKWDWVVLQNADSANDYGVDEYPSDMFLRLFKESSRLEHLESRYRDKWEEKKLQRIYKEIKDLPVEEKHTFVFSKPVFSDNYALMSLRIYAFDEFLEYCFLFRKNEGKWIIQANKIYNGWLIQG